jgi:diguanylate cyclase
MTRMQAFACFAALMVLPAPRITSSPLIVGDAPSYLLGGHLEILQDDTGAKSFARVSSDSASWKATTQDEPNPGFTTTVYWVRFELESPSPQQLLLAFDWPLVNLVNLHVIHPDGTLEHMASGDRIPFAERSLPYRFYPLFPIALQPNRPAWCYVQVLDVQSVFPLSLWNERAFFRKADHNEQVTLGFFMGLFLSLSFLMHCFLLQHVTGHICTTFSLCFLTSFSR